MNITRDIKSILKTVRKNTSKADREKYSYFLKRQNYIRNYYDDNREKFLINEKVLLNRRNYLYNEIYNSAVSTKSIAVSIACSIIASIVFCMFYGNDGFIEFFAIEATNNVYRYLIGIFVIIILMAFITVMFVNVIYNGFKSDKCFDDLKVFEFSLIENILNEEYSLENSEFIQENLGEFDGMLNNNENPYKQNFKWDIWNTEQGKTLIFLTICISIILLLSSSLTGNWKIFNIGFHVLLLSFFGFYVCCALKALFMLLKSNKQESKNDRNINC